ncbi:gamma-glutamylcyclotransferase family protein [Pelagicoccus albus]|uniref:Gamma-glutamylcyclotransferase n=1 Tax=Pelagicoccus albus TaxID=415222 RepID=A0A7X1E999_9BACT|nr:gamma-glutamylcyclotransferase family protein [Pelagicoccus albus]MBC2607116.1 gamma-glutamylcyclotransferase [Pelagicoccus albus]
MDTQFLFAYGTLKSDQPEHSIHCVPPLSVEPAKALGSLWRLREGYPILQVDPEQAIVDASLDTKEDWMTALEFSHMHDPVASDQGYIEGELFEYPLEPGSLRKMDEWENFIPGVKSAYQRRVIWVKDSAGKDRIAWAYICYSPPNWAVLLNSNSWPE